VAIADENLRCYFTPPDRREFELAERSGLVRVVLGAADPEILRWAETSGARVLSTDGFVGHRRRHPWIQGAKDQFFGWEVGPTGDVRVVALDMGVAHAYSLSRGEEADMLKARGLDPSRASDRELLSHAYRCTNDDCLTAKFSPERLLVPPARRHRAPVCPGCASPLNDLGARPDAVEIVIEIGDREIGRKVLEEGRELTLGRADLATLRDRDAVAALARVSRDHVAVRAQRRMLRVRDLQSRNGTSVTRWNSVTDEFDKRQLLVRGESVELGHRDFVILAGAVRIRRSGQQFAIASGAFGGRAPNAGVTTEDEDVQ